MTLCAARRGSRCSPPAKQGPSLGALGQEPEEEPGMTWHMVVAFAPDLHISAPRAQFQSRHAVQHLLVNTVWGAGGGGGWWGGGK